MTPGPSAWCRDQLVGLQVHAICSELVDWPGRAELLIAVGAVDPIPDDSVDGTNAWYIFGAADLFAEKSVADFPGKHRRICALVLGNLQYHRSRCNLRLAPANNAGLYWTCLVESAQDLAHTAMGDTQLSGYVAWTNPTLCKLDDASSYVLWKRPAIYKNSSELVHSSVAWEERRASVEDLGKLICLPSYIWGTGSLPCLECCAILLVPQNVSVFELSRNQSGDSGLTQALLNSVTRAVESETCENQIKSTNAIKFRAGVTRTNG